MLPEELHRDAMRRAQELGISFGEVVREALRSMLKRESGMVREGDSLFADTASYAGDSAPDTAEKHDDHLYE